MTQQQRVHRRDKVIDWAAYTVIASGIAWMIANQTKALDILASHSILMSSFSTWAKIVALRLGIPFG